MNRFLIVGAALGAALSLAGTAKLAAAAEDGRAAAPDSLADAYRLEALVVSGEPPAGLGMTAAWRAGALAEMGGADAADLLRRDAALVVSSGAKAETETRLRGFPARATLILIDGRPVNPGYYGKVDLSMVDASALAAVQIVKGPASSSWGPNALGGVVNLVTRSAFDAPGFRSSVRLGDNGHRRFSAGHGFRRGSIGIALHGYDHRRDAVRLSRDFEPTSLEEGPTRTGSGFAKTGGGLKASWERTDRDVYTATVDYHWSRRDVPPTIYAWDAPTWRRFPNWSRFGASLNNQRRLGHGLELTTILHADGQDDRLIDYRDRTLSEDAINWDSQLRNRALGGSVHLGGASGDRHRYRLGLTGKHDQLRKQPDIGEPWSRHRILTGSLHGEHRWQARPTLALTGSLQATSFGSDAREGVEVALSPLVSCRWTPLAHTAAWLTWARARRYPTLHMLYSETSGNVDLRPERADRWEAGVERRLLARGGVRLSAAAAWFHDDLVDLIDRPARSQRFDNVAEATLSGVEATLSAALGSIAALEVGALWLDRGATTAVMLRGVPPLRVNMALTVRATSGTTARYDVTLQDERTTHVADRRLAAHSLHQASIRQRVSRGLTLHLEVFNLTDLAYEDELGYPAPGRTVSLGLDWR